MVEKSNRWNAPEIFLVLKRRVINHKLCIRVAVVPAALYRIYHAARCRILCRLKIGKVLSLESLKLSSSIAFPDSRIISV